MKFATKIKKHGATLPLVLDPEGFLGIGPEGTQQAADDKAFSFQAGDLTVSGYGEGKVEISGDPSALAKPDTGYTNVAHALITGDKIAFETITLDHLNHDVLEALKKMVHSTLDLVMTDLKLAVDKAKDVQQKVEAKHAFIQKMEHDIKEAFDAHSALYLSPGPAISTTTPQITKKLPENANPEQMVHAALDLMVAAGISFGSHSLTHQQSGQEFPTVEYNATLYPNGSKGYDAIKGISTYFNKKFNH